MASTKRTPEQSAHLFGFPDTEATPSFDWSAVTHGDKLIEADMARMAMRQGKWAERQGKWAEQSAPLFGLEASTQEPDHTSIGWMAKPKEPDIYSTTHIVERERQLTTFLNTFENFKTAHPLDPTRMRWLFHWLSMDGADLSNESIHSNIHKALEYLNGLWPKKYFNPFCDYHEANSIVSADKNAIVVRLSSSDKRTISITFFLTQAEHIRFRLTSDNQLVVISASNEVMAKVMLVDPKTLTLKNRLYAATLTKLLHALENSCQ